MSQGYSAWYEFHEAHILRDSGQAFWEKNKTKQNFIIKERMKLIETMSGLNS